MKHTLVWLFVALLVLLLRLSTPTAAPMNDAREYLAMATFGLSAESHLSAPFSYRPAVPLFVWALSHALDVEPLAVFPLVTLVAAFLLLLAIHDLALRAGVSTVRSLLLTLLLAASVFVVRFPLHCPLYIDIEAVAISTAAFGFLLQRRYLAALLLSLLGLFFKEFLLVPLIAMTGILLQQYLYERSTWPLRWTTLTLVLTVILFTVPRLLIPVEVGYGANFQYRPAEPSQTVYLSQLRSFLAWPPRLGIAVNLLLAVVSFWLPALMLTSAGRLRHFWQALGANRLLVALWILGVLALASVGGTNLMIFVVYTVPVLVLALAHFLRTNIHRAELAVVVIGTLVFNRIFFPLGLEGGDPGGSIAFYGAYWHLLDSVTVWRFVEAGGWVASAQLVRILVRLKPWVSALHRP